MVYVQILSSYQYEYLRMIPSGLYIYIYKIPLYIPFLIPGLNRYTRTTLVGTLWSAHEGSTLISFFILV